MDALIYQGPERLSFEDAPMPVPEAGEVLVRVQSSGICGSDMHAYLGHDPRRPAPLIMGHEAAGIAETGPLRGKPVTINPLMSCGTCGYCQEGRENICQSRRIISMPPCEGAFAQYVKIAADNLVEMPAGFDPSKGALAEPIACGWHAVRLGRAASFAPPARALVIGGGPIGVGAALSLIAQGIADVTLSEPNALRRDYLADQPFAVVAPETVAEGSFPLVIDGVGFEPTRAAASHAVTPGGVIAHIGLGSDEGGLDVRRMTLQEITFFGTYTYTAQDFRDTAKAMFEGRLGALDWIEERPLAEGWQSFKDIRAGVVAAPKIVLKP